VQEYWIIDWRKPQLEIYRRAQATLKLVATLLPNDELSSPLLPGFTHPVSQLFA
jgi:Uma2 family endonuclease